MAASELIKIAKYGSEIEKEVFSDHYNYNEYTYDFENPSSSTNQPTKTNDNSGTNEEIPGSSGSPDTNDSNNSGNNKKRKNGGNDNDSRETKRVKVEEEVKQNQTKKDEEVSAKITNALQGLSKNTTDQEKENKLAEIEKSKNEGKISEEQKTKITEKKDELAKNDPQGYGKMMAEVLEKKINEFKVEIDKLGQIIQDKLNKLKNGEYTSDVEVRQVEEEVSEKVSEEVAVVETDNLLNQAQKVLNATAAYQTKKDKVEKALKDLENVSQNKTQETGFFRPEVIVPVSILAVLAVVAIVIVRRRKQAKVK
ncbi:6983_t:CDS:2 [Paraglomus occultum]|uniref:6983_t:CDS:1 n=1 Tax=Paraglomus occultum TaxID=144539 RepID=A0A9N8Z600_9GLOM|nr:6983_t:CDS:2 [Paraglomus occultum]